MLVNEGKSGVYMPKFSDQNCNFLFKSDRESETYIISTVLHHYHSFDLSIEANFFHFCWKNSELALIENLEMKKTACNSERLNEQINFD